MFLKPCNVHGSHSTFLQVPSSLSLPFPWVPIVFYLKWTPPSPSPGLPPIFSNLQLYFIFIFIYISSRLGFTGETTSCLLYLLKLPPVVSRTSRVQRKVETKTIEKHHLPFPTSVLLGFIYLSITFQNIRKNKQGSPLYSSRRADVENRGRGGRKGNFLFFLFWKGWIQVPDRTIATAMVNLFACNRQKENTIPRPSIHRQHRR